ncbi:hypothetical protein D9M71_430230 [compost metagenome]
MSRRAQSVRLEDLLVYRVGGELQQRAGLLETQARASRKQLGGIAITEVAEEVRLDLHAREAGCLTVIGGEECPVDLVMVEAGHRPAVQPHGARREDEVAALHRTVA